jgi:hypothetical protein
MIPYVFTILTHEGGRYFDLLDSARRWGWKLHSHFITPEEGPFEASYHKFIAKKHHCIANVLQGRDYFLYLDAWDTVFTGPRSEVPFEPGRLHFSGSLDCYPEKGYAKYFPEAPFPYLNSGVIWGKASDYLRLCPEEWVLDQLAWTRRYVQSPEAFIIDGMAATALTLFGVGSNSNFAYRGGRWVYLPTGSTPVIVHAAGKVALPEFFLK